MIELFPAKCCDEILRCGGSVWAGVVMNHTISETQVHQTQFREEVTVKFEENGGKVT